MTPKMSRLNRKFFLRHPKETAPLLLGKYIVRVLPEGKIIAKIVETEAYGGKEDKGCHIVRFGRTKRTEILFGEVGHAYVYAVYINTYCLNVVCHGKNEAGGVLIRAAEPISGVELILKNLNKDGSYEITKLLNGPGKLCRGLKIDKSLNGEDLIKSKELYLTEGEKIDSSQIIATARINIPYAEECKDWLWRFIIKDSKFVSR